MRNFENCLTRKEVFVLFFGFISGIACFFMRRYISDYLPALFAAYTSALAILILEHQPFLSKENLVLSTLLLTGTFGYGYAISKSAGSLIAECAFGFGIFASVALTMLLCIKQERDPKLIYIGIIAFVLSISLFALLFLCDKSFHIFLKKMIAVLLTSWSVSAFGNVFFNFFKRNFCR